MDPLILNRGASFRWSFCPHYAWGSKESKTILTTHPSLVSWYTYLSCSIFITSVEVSFISISRIAFIWQFQILEIIEMSIWCLFRGLYQSSLPNQVLGNQVTWKVFSFYKTNVSDKWFFDNLIGSTLKWLMKSMGCEYIWILEWVFGWRSIEFTLSRLQR